MVDELLFDDGMCRLRVCITGVGRDTGTISRDGFGLSIYAYSVSPDVDPLFTHTLDIEGAAQLHALLDGISIVRDASRLATGRFLEVDVNVPEAVVQALLAHPELVNDPGFVQAVLDESRAMSGHP